MTRRVLSLCLVASALLVLASCEPHLTSADRQRVELVMRPGTTITATTPVGRIVIHANSELRRTYVFDSTSISEVLIPRQAGYGWNLGIYNGAMDWGIWPRDRRGVYRGVVEEGQHHFDTKERALHWVRKELRDMPYVYRSDGLVVGWSTTPSRHQLNCDVWQIYIRDRKPRDLAGSADDAIVVSEEAPSRP